MPNFAPTDAPAGDAAARSARSGDEHGSTAPLTPRASADGSGAPVSITGSDHPGFDHRASSSTTCSPPPYSTARTTCGLPFRRTSSPTAGSSSRVETTRRDEVAVLVGAYTHVTPALDRSCAIPKRDPFAAALAALEALGQEERPAPARQLVTEESTEDAPHCGADTIGRALDEPLYRKGFSVGGVGISAARVRVEPTASSSTFGSVHDFFHSTAFEIGAESRRSSWSRSSGSASPSGSTATRGAGSTTAGSLPPRRALGLVPFIGPLVYLLFRPPETLEDARAREIEIRALESRLAKTAAALPGLPERGRARLSRSARSARRSSRSRAAAATSRSSACGRPARTARPRSRSAGGRGSRRRPHRRGPHTRKRERQAAQSPRRPAGRPVPAEKRPAERAFRGADARIRTADPFITSEVLYQLSYVGAKSESTAAPKH